VLFAFYGFYIWSLRRDPAAGIGKGAGRGPVARFMCAQPPAPPRPAHPEFLVAGGLLLYFMATPFLESMLALSIQPRISQFVFIQWLAPFLSEFPEKVSAFNWARKVRNRADGRHEHGVQQLQPMDGPGRNAAHRVLELQRASASGRVR